MLRNVEKRSMTSGAIAPIEDPCRVFCCIGRSSAWVQSRSVSGLGIRAYLFAATNDWGGYPPIWSGVPVDRAIALCHQRYRSDLSLCGCAQLPGAPPPCPDWWGVCCEYLYVARMLFTAVMAQSSYTLVYGAFASVPLFLLWIYVTWIIVLIGAVLTHSLSAYQTTEQAQTPTLNEGLDILYCFGVPRRTAAALLNWKLFALTIYSPVALTQTAGATSAIP